MSYWFGNGITKKTEKVRLPDGSVRQQPASADVLVLPRFAPTSSGNSKQEISCAKGCGRKFTHGPARAHHEKVCTGGKATVLRDVDEDVVDEGEDGDDEEELEHEPEVVPDQIAAAPIPYPFDPPPSETTNTAAHDAVANELGIDSSTPVETYDELLRANPVVLHRLAVTQGLYARMEMVASRARALVRMEMMAEEVVAEGAAAGRSGAAAAGTSGENAAAGTSGENAPKRQKLRKDGGFKQSGLREGDKKTARTLYFKYEVAKYYHQMQKQKERGLCARPLEETCEHFGAGITPGQVSTW